MAYERYGFNTYKYGSSDRLYGLPASPIANRLWSIEIDRDNDGSFNGENEAFYCIGMDIDRGFLDEFDDKGQGYSEHFAPPMVGKCTLTFDNSTGRYDLWTGTGAPSTDNLPGRQCRIRVREGYSGTDRDVFFGFIKDIRNDPTDETATMILHDGVEILQERRAKLSTTASSDTGTSAPLALLRILDDIGWVYGYDFVDSGTQATIGYFYCDDTAFRVIHNLCKIEENLFYINTAGEVVFDEVTQFTKASSNTYDEELFLKPVYISQPWENVFTKLQRYRYDYTFGATDTVIWSKEDSFDIDVSAGETNEFIIDYRYDDSTVSRYVIRDPFVASSDIVANTVSDGSGTDLSASFSATIADLGGSSGLITITNSSTDGGFVTSIQARGTPLYWRRVSQEIDIDNWADAGERTFVMDSPYNESYPATLYDQFVYLGYPHRAKRVTLRIQNRAEQFTPDINELMYFTVTKPYLISSGDTEGYNAFRVMRIRHKWLSPNGQDVLTEWTCRSALSATAPITT